ncbi:MAG: glycosyltransferase [Candidatus Bathyarchaeota archaeon]|nr:glycosyltransferase [Candidatus Bathyarchaeota archaeon]
MNILQVIPVFNPPEFFGGSQQVVYQISKELSKRGHEVTVFCSDAKRSNLKESTENKTETFEGINVRHFDNKYPFLSDKFGFFYTPAIKKAFSDQKFDLIHLHELRGYQHIVAFKFAKETNVPYIIQAHGILGQSNSASRKIFDFFYGREILFNAQAVLALNKKEQEQYTRAGVPIGKTCIIPNGLNLSEYAQMPAKGVFKRKYHIAEKEQVILYLGRIHRVKGLDVLVKSFAKVLNQKNNVTLVIAGGDDGFLNQLMSLIASFNILNKVVFTGPLSGADKKEALVDADLFVLPSWYEMFPMALLEAYACGKKVVSSEFEGIHDFVPNSTAMLFKPGDVDQLSDVILSALKNDADMCLNASKFVSIYDISNICTQIEDVYKSVIAETKNS